MSGERAQGLKREMGKLSCIRHDYVPNSDSLQGGRHADRVTTAPTLMKVA